MMFSKSQFEGGSQIARSPATAAAVFCILFNDDEFVGKEVSVVGMVFNIVESSA
ncbi:hypothetical protein HanPI659440_Chr02g0088081 [Helianthus annuus]|nr:hypothetical protein HanPI659440_Chr02g0088081 [Helianthus annuus]